MALTVQDEAITQARIVATGVGSTPVRASAAESILAGGPLDPARTQVAMDALRAAIDPEADVHATIPYRRHLAGVLLDRAVQIAHDRAQRQSNVEG